LLSLLDFSFNFLRFAAASLAFSRAFFKASLSRPFVLSLASLASFSPFFLSLSAFYAAFSASFNSF